MIENNGNERIIRWDKRLKLRERDNENARKKQKIRKCEVNRHKLREKRRIEM